MMNGDKWNIIKAFGIMVFILIAIPLMLFIMAIFLA